MPISWQAARHSFVLISELISAGFHTTPSVFSPGNIARASFTDSATG